MAALGKMASVEEDCHNNPNFAVICSFIIQFGETCGINLTIERLQEMLEDTKTLHEELRELHIKLLRKARKWFGKEKWEKALIKFCHQYSNVDAWEIERFGYKKAKLSVKLEALKRLLEMQFDTNSKFKTGINQQDASNLRLLPVGRDVKGLMYWYQVDEELNLRIYSEEAENERSWKLLCKTRHDLATLLSSLEACGLQYVKDESSSVCSENGDSSITELSNKEKKPIKEEPLENSVKQETASINDKEDIKPQVLDLSTTIAAKSENTTLESEEKLSLEIPISTGITIKPSDIKTVSESQPMDIVVSSNQENPELSQTQNNVKTEETSVTEPGNSLVIDRSSHSDINTKTAEKELGHLKCQSAEQMQPLDLSRENNVEKNVQSVLIKEDMCKLSHRQVQKQNKEELLSAHGGVSVTNVNMSTSKSPHTTEVSNHIGNADVLNSLVVEDSLCSKISDAREFKHKIYYKKLDICEKPELNLDKLSEKINSDKESVSQEKEIKAITESHLSLDPAKIDESVTNVPDANQKLNKEENKKNDLSSSTNDNRHNISKLDVPGCIPGENLTVSEVAKATKETNVNHVAKAEKSNNDQANIKSEHSEQTKIKCSQEVNKPSLLTETNLEKDVCTSQLVNNENILQGKIDKLTSSKNPCAVNCNSANETSTTIQEVQTDSNEVDTIKLNTAPSLTVKEVDGIQDLQGSKIKESDSNKQSKISTDSSKVCETVQDSQSDENQINCNQTVNKAESNSTKECEDSVQKEQTENLSPQKKFDEQTKSHETVSVSVESAEVSTLENKTLDVEETVEKRKNASKTKKKKSVRGRKLRSRKCNNMKKPAHKIPDKVIEKESGGDSESVESENNQKNISCNAKKGEEASLTIPKEVILAAGKNPRRGRSRSRGRGRGRGRGRQVTRKGGVTAPSNSGALKRGRGRGPKVFNGSDGSDSPNLHIKRSRRIQEQQQKKLSELAEALEREQRHLEELAKKKVATTKEKTEPPAPPPDEETKENKKEKKKKRRRKRHRGKKRTSYNPWDVSSESTSSSEEEEFHVAEEEEEEDEEELKFDENYDEFACEEYDENEEPVIVKRARTAKKVHSDNESNSSSEMEGDDKPCGRCGQKDHPEWILLCDKCDSGYHTACLNPPLMIVPDGNWYCPPCEHKMLCEKLSETLKSLDQMMKKKEREELRKQRLAYVGISLDNVLKPEKKEKSESDEGEEEKEESDKDDKLFSYRSSRPRRSVSYQFKEFDELINSAIEEDIIEGRGAGAGKGKDMSNITGAEERESKKKRRHRRLNDLDTTSEEGDSDVEYKDTSSDTEVSQSGGSDDYVVESDDSGWGKKTKKSGDHHRRKHHRRGKLDEFIDDEWNSDASEEYRPCTRRAAQKNISYKEISSDDDGDWGPIKKKPRRKWGSESESDKDWQGRKNKQGKRASRKMRLSDSEETEEDEEVSNGSSEESFISKSQKKKVSNSLRSRKDFSEGEMSEEEEDRSKTRKKKINYSEMISSDNRCTEKSRRLKNNDISEDDETENEESSESEESKDEGMTIGKKRRIIKSDDDDDDEEEVQQQPNDKKETVTVENSMQKIGKEQKCNVAPDQSLSEITHEKLIEPPAQRSVIKHSDSYLQKQQVSYIHPEAAKSQNHSIKQQIPEVKTTLVTESPISNLGVSTIHLQHSLSSGTSVTVVQAPLTQSSGVVIPIVRPSHTQSPGVGVPVVRGPHPQSSGINVPVAGPPHQHSPAVGVPMVRGPHPLMSGTPVIGPSMPQSSGVSVSGTRSLHPQAACVNISGIRPSHPSSPNVPPIKPEALQSLGSFENKSSPIKPSLIETYPSSPSPSKLTSLDSSPSRLLPMDAYSRSSPYSQRSISPPSREYGSSSPPSDQYRPQGFGLSFSQDQYYGQGYIRPPNAGAYLPPTSGQESFRTQFMGPYASAPSRPSEYFPNPMYYSPPGDSHGQPTNYSQTPPPGPTYYYSQSPQQQNGNYSVTPLQRPPASEGGEEGELTRVSDIFSYMAQD